MPTRPVRRTVAVLAMAAFALAGCDQPYAVREVLPSDAGETPSEIPDSAANEVELPGDGEPGVDGADGEAPANDPLGTDDGEE